MRHSNLTANVADGVKTGKSQIENNDSAAPLKADILNPGSWPQSN